MTSQPKVMVLATSHRLQGTNFLNPVDDDCYRKIVEETILSEAIDVVFEEAGGKLPTYAQEIAKEITNAKERLIDYLDMDPPVEERERHGLSKQTSSSFPVDLWANPPCSACEQHLADHAAREQFWLERIREKTFASALVILGWAHGLSFSFRLMNVGYEVRNVVYYPDDKL